MLEVIIRQIDIIGLKNLLVEKAKRTTLTVNEYSTKLEQHDSAPRRP